MQTGSTSCGVSLSQTNGLRLFDAVFHRNLLFIIPQARDDIGPCLPRVTLMSLIAPPVRLPTTTGSRYRDKTLRGRVSPLSLSLPPSLFFSLSLSLSSPLSSFPGFIFGSSRVPSEINQPIPLSPTWIGALLSPENDAVLLLPRYLLPGRGNDDPFVSVYPRSLTRVYAWNGRDNRMIRV